MRFAQGHCHRGESCWRRRLEQIPRRRFQINTRMYPLFPRKEFVVSSLPMVKETNETCLLLSASDFTLLEPPVPSLCHSKTLKVYILLLPIFAEKKSAAPDSRQSFSPTVQHDERFHLPPLLASEGPLI